MRFERGDKHPRWRGGIGFHCLGYVRVYSGRKERELQHRVVIENALGKKIPKKAVTHHFDQNKSYNGNSNLVLCENRAYHNLLHRRQRAYNECGHANWFKCWYCGKYDDPKNMYIQEKKGNRLDARHNDCHKKYMEKYHDFKRLSKKSD